MKFAWTMLGLLLACGTSRAGIYNTTEEAEIRLSENVNRFWTTLIEVRSIGADTVEKDNLLRKRYFLNEALGGAKPPEGLTLEQKLDYSAVLIRRKKFQQAINFLEPLSRKHPEIFLFDSHLAMAYWGSGQQGNDNRALEILSDVLKRRWPANFDELSEEQRAFFENSMGWNEGPFAFYRSSETYLLKMMKLRLAKPGGVPFEAVDALFDDGKKPATAVRFVNDEGKFEPGAMAAAERQKLPKDALAHVEQLLLWLPEDLRLYWLLGELANSKWKSEDLTFADDPKVPKAQRDQAIARRDQAVENLKAANQIYDELVYVHQVRAADLRDRTQTLKDFSQSVTPTAPSLDEFDAEVKKINDGDAARIPMTTRTIVTTFAAGMAVGIFAIWQFQEFRRRRRGG